MKDLQRSMPKWVERKIHATRVDFERRVYNVLCCANVAANEMTAAIGQPYDAERYYEGYARGAYTTFCYMVGGEQPDFDAWMQGTPVNWEPATLPNFNPVFVTRSPVLVEWETRSRFSNSQGTQEG
jgi:hypothetical protein